MSEEILQTGSIVHRGEPIPATYSSRYAWVTCGGCGDRRIANQPTGKKRATWTGLCVPCSGVYRRRSGSERHASGTMIHWNERDPEDSWNRVAITCHSCHRKSFTHINSIKHSNWSGLCGACIEQRGSHLKFTHDLRFESGTIIHWGEPDPKAPTKRLMVTCGKCGEKRSITRCAASILKHDNGAWHCRQCHASELRAHFASQREQSREVKLKPQKARGRERGAVIFDRDDFLSKVNQSIAELHKTARARSITREAVAEKLQLQGVNVGAMGVKKRLMLCGITLEWRDFVEAALSQTTQH